MNTKTSESNPVLDALDYDKRLSEYVGSLFGKGELLDVISIAQKELETHPANLDMIVYRACACLVLQVSGTVPQNTELVEQIINQLDLVAELVSLQIDYDASLNYYTALGYLVLGKFAQADRTLERLKLDDLQDANALTYFEDRKKFWEGKKPFSPRPFENIPPS